MSGKTFSISNEEYDRFVADIRNCPGGCLRPRGLVRAMLRPAGGFRVPPTGEVNRCTEVMDKCCGTFKVSPFFGG